MSGASKTPESTPNLSEAERKLLRLMSDVGFGRIKQLRVINGQPNFSNIRIIRDIKLGAQDDVQRPSGDFALKRELRAFFTVLRRLDAAIIRKVEIRHGLPAHLQVEEAMDAGGGRR